MEDNSNANWIITGVGALIILVGGWWIVTHNSSLMQSGTASSTGSMASSSSMSSDESTGSSSSTMTNETTMATGEALSVADQSVGETVAVKSITLSKPGWVAIRDERGWTLGAAWFETGTYTDASVSLLRATEAGKRYQALLYIDTVGDHTFDLHAETLVTNADGSVAGSMFTAQ